MIFMFQLSKLIPLPQIRNWRIPFNSNPICFLGHSWPQGQWRKTNSILIKLVKISWLKRRHTDSENTPDCKTARVSGLNKIGLMPRGHIWEASNLVAPHCTNRHTAIRRIHSAHTPEYVNSTHRRRGATSECCKWANTWFVSYHYRTVILIIFATLSHTKGRTQGQAHTW
jgi:hypothetical protein